jgi:ribonuclease P protein subunit RPR2
MKERSKTPRTRKIAKERIARLFEEAQAVFPDYPAMSNRYVAIARKIAMRQRVQIVHPFRRRFCRSCSSFLVPGKTARVRIHPGHITTTCLSCGRRRRYPLPGRRPHGKA